MRKGAWLWILIFVGLIGTVASAQEQTPSLTSSGTHESMQTPSDVVFSNDVRSGDLAQNDSEPIIVAFFADGCPQCEIMDDLLSELLVGHEDIPVARYNINSPDSAKLQLELAAHYGIITTEPPVIFVGEKAVVGSGRSQEIKLRTAVGDCIQRGCASPLEHVEEGKEFFHDLLIVGGFLGLFLALLIFQGL
jgi:thiol-disulfide isomerase/thioredoxin